MQLRPPLNTYLYRVAAQHCGVVFVESVQVGDLHRLVHVAGRGLGGVDGRQRNICVWHIFP